MKNGKRSDITILVPHSVPLNCGDEALLRAFLHGIKTVLPRARVIVLCKDSLRVAGLLPDIEIRSDLEYCSDNKPCLTQIMLSIVHRLMDSTAGFGLKSIPYKLLLQLSEVFSSVERCQVLAEYKACDFVLPAPGGYLHDYYELDNRIRAIQLAISLDKPVHILGHSVGPFWKDKSAVVIRDLLKQVKSICVREQYSVSHLLRLGLPEDSVKVTTDLAFLWNQMTSVSKVTIESSMFGICFREWPLGDQESLSRLINKAVEYVTYLLENNDVSLTFISTCQGVDGYVDDSNVAKQIVSHLDSRCQMRVVIDSLHYTPAKLIDKLASFEAFIGMRLHGCILSMVAGTPALGIAYEDKTPGIYSSLGLAEYQFDHREKMDVWIASLSTFMLNLKQLRKELPERVAEAANRAIETFSVLNEYALAGDASV